MHYYILFYAMKKILYFCSLKKKKNHNKKVTEMNNTINIREGLGDIRFGMPVEAVLSVLGEAQSVETIDNNDDETTTILHYDDGALTLFFEGENPTLSCIDISDDNCTLFGEAVFDMEEKEIVQLMVKNNYYEQDVDQEAWGERRVSFGEGNIDFFFEDGDLSAIVYGN